MRSRDNPLAFVLVFNGLLIVLLAGAPAAAQCGNTLLSGRYLYTFQGSGWQRNADIHLAGSAYGFTAAGHMFLNRNGEGNGNDTMSIAGQIIPREYNVHYSIHPDCTGSMTLEFHGTIDGEGPANIVLSGDGHDALFINTIPGVAVTGRLVRVAGGSCSSDTLSGAYVFMTTGSGLNVQGNAIRTASSAIFASVGRLRVEGGMVRADDTISLGGLIIPRSYEASYSVDSNCTGHFSPGGVNPAAIYIGGDGNLFVLLNGSPGTVVSGWFERK